MWKRKRMPSMQVPRSLHRNIIPSELETNLRIVSGWSSHTLACRRVRVVSAVWSDSLRASLCSILRKRDRLAAIPFPGKSDELLVVANEPVAIAAIRTDAWNANLEDTGTTYSLPFDDPSHQQLIAELVEKMLVLSFEQSDDFWRLSDSTRIWYREDSLREVEGIEAISRVSFATIPIPGNGIGVAFDHGCLYRTRLSVAEFWDPTVTVEEKKRRRTTFDRLRARHDGRKGTLLYDIQKADVKVCYYERFAEEMTCATTGPIMGRASLYDYYQHRYPTLEVSPSDAVAYVSFRGMPHEVPVAAKLLRLRIAVDPLQLPRDLRRSTTLSPHIRRSRTIEVWKQFGTPEPCLNHCRLAKSLWRPSADLFEVLPCPELRFGQGRTVRPPSTASVEEYQRYYRGRLDSLRKGGVYYFDPGIRRELHVVTPTAASGWPEGLQRTFVRDFVDCVTDLTGSRFTALEVRADGADAITERLRALQPGTTVVVFDDRGADSATYALLSHELRQWRLKRLTRRKVEDAWRERTHQSHGHGREQGGLWKRLIEHSVLDTLEQMGAIPWRIASLPYESCLAIDVGDNRRHFAISLLICRDEQKRPGLFRATRVWPKGDHQHEQINAEILRDKVVQLCDEYRGTTYSPLGSMVVLRDGHRCGDEVRGINEAVEMLRKSGRMMQACPVDIIHVHKRTVKGLRAWLKSERECANALEGTAIYLDDCTSLVNCTGAATVSRSATVDPCLLVAAEPGVIRKASQAFFALSQHNYSTPTKAHRYAQPLRDTDALLRHRLAQDMRGIR
jgi:hypothetical protein